MSGAVSDDQAIQVLSQAGDPARPPSPVLALKLVVGLAIVVVAVFSAARWIGQPPDDERTVRAFAAAVDGGRVAEARSLIGDPTILMWPTYWSFLNIEHVSPFGDRLDGFIEYQHALQTRTAIGDCTNRPTAPDEPTGYDSWLRCDYTLSDALSGRLAGTQYATSGQLSVGITDGRIRTVFVIRSDRPAILANFRSWIAESFSERYANLLTQPAVLQLDVPIIGLAVTDYSGPTARTLLEFADAYATAGFPVLAEAKEPGG